MAHFMGFDFDKIPKFKFHKKKHNPNGEKHTSILIATDIIGKGEKQN